MTPCVCVCDTRLPSLLPRNMHRAMVCHRACMQSSASQMKSVANTGCNCKDIFTPLPIGLTWRSLSSRALQIHSFHKVAVNFSDRGNLVIWLDLLQCRCAYLPNPVEQWRPWLQ